MVIKLANESPANPSTLLIDRVQQRIRHILDAMNSPFIQTYRLQLDINLSQLLTIVRQALEQDPLWMRIKKMIKMVEDYLLRPALQNL